MNEIFVFGASGHAKVVIDLVERQGLHRVVGLFDDDRARWGESFFGYSILGGRDSLVRFVQPHRAGVLAIGSNEARRRLHTWCAEQRIPLISVVHPSAQVAREVSIGVGAVVAAGAILNSGTTLGTNTIVNTAATIDHDCVIGDYVHVAPGCHLCGGVKVGAGSFLGAGTVVIPNISIGVDVIVGAGATVVTNLPDGAKAIGSPCRIV